MQGRFALHVASKALEYYAETVFKVPYPLKKSDLLAIPGEWSGFLFVGTAVAVHAARTQGLPSAVMAAMVCVLHSALVCSSTVGTYDAHLLRSVSDKQVPACRFFAFSREYIAGLRHQLQGDTTTAVAQ